MKDSDLNKILIIGNMLIDVTKEELEVIVLQLWKSRKSEENVRVVYEKMEPLLNICNCQEKDG